MDKLSLRADIGGSPLQQVGKTHQVWGQYGQMMQNIFEYCHRELQQTGPLKITLSKDRSSFSVIDASGTSLSVQGLQAYGDVLSDLNRILEYLNSSQGTSSSSYGGLPPLSSSSMSGSGRMRDLEALQMRTQSQLEQLTAQVGRRLEDSAEVREERDRLHDELGRVRAELVELRAAQTASAESPLATSLRELAKAVRRERGEAAARIDQLSARVDSLPAQLKAEIGAVATLLKEAQTASQGQLEALTNRFTEALERRSEKELAELKKELLELRQEREAFLLSVKSIVVELQQGGVGVAEQIQLLLAEQKTSNKEVIDLLQQILACLQKGEGGQGELINRLVSAIEKIEGGLGEFRIAIEESRARIERLEEEVAKLRGMPGLAEQLEHNHQQMMTLVGSLHQAVLEGIGDRQEQNQLLLRLNLTIDDLARQIAELNAKIGALQLTTTIVQEKSEGPKEDERPKPSSSSSSTSEPVLPPPTEAIEKLYKNWTDGKEQIRIIGELLRLQPMKQQQVEEQRATVARLQEARDQLGSFEEAEKAYKESNQAYLALNRKSSATRAEKQAALTDRTEKLKIQSTIVGAEAELTEAKIKLEKLEKELAQIPKSVDELFSLHGYILIKYFKEKGVTDPVAAAASVIGVTNLSRLREIESGAVPNRNKIINGTTQLTHQLAKSRTASVSNPKEVNKARYDYFSRES